MADVELVQKYEIALELWTSTSSIENSGESSIRYGMRLARDHAKFPHLDINHFAPANQKFSHTRAGLNMLTSAWYQLMIQLDIGSWGTPHVNIFISR